MGLVMAARKNVKQVNIIDWGDHYRVLAEEAEVAKAVVEAEVTAASRRGSARR